ncbi:glycosyltransferase family 4 protein [Chitiniphilus purpureus]|uniref:Glycosyltransferase family 4 protein n=1 Tax=Chitiniphilus purpureus TaxID=2981137 RepID=A0ABY6DMP9_9NEIS|nr:glycosyltransferase family 4 protein [Chitiniphilus sp. CD1]UXY15619.1 glycosyltransferase family 4 protein [Chitiniphilus sp. CD1]
MKPQIYSPMAMGNGAYVIHQRLANALPGYQLHGYSPWLTLCPPLLLTQRKSAPVIHTTPDYAPFLWQRGQHRIITFHNYVLDPFIRGYSSALQSLHYRTDLRAFIRRALAGAQIVTAVSAATARLIREDLNYQGEIRVIYNGVDPHHFRPSLPSPAVIDRPLRVLFSGNPSQRKGIHWLPEIARAAGPGFEFWVTAGLRNQHQLGKLASLSNVRLIPPQQHTEMPAIYRAVDILLAPTVREGGPSLAVLEAMACGLPIVASALPEITEAVTDGVGGYLVPLGEVSGFVAALKALCDPLRRAQMGNYNTCQVVNGGWTEARMVKEYQQLFAEPTSCLL